MLKILAGNSTANILPIIEYCWCIGNIRATVEIWALLFIINVVLA